MTKTKNIIVPAILGKKNAGLISKIEDFLKKYSTSEIREGGSHLIYLDPESGASYILCHLEAKTLVNGADLDAVLDPREGEEYKLNRDIYTDNQAYKIMEKDAINKRVFEDIVVEFDDSYRPHRPFKVFGGQHRVQAISEALKKGTSESHGIRVYFNLNVEQRVNIAVANNTAIAVSNDLLDRMQEDFAGGSLREWCQTVGILKDRQNFSDKRDPEGIPTVRVARTLVVNYFRGKEAQDQQDHPYPIVCASGKPDENYSRLRKGMVWDDLGLKRMGEEFAKLHRTQRECVLGREEDRYTEFANKCIHPCVAASWAFAAGYLQGKPEALKAHYGLRGVVDSPKDPLNAGDLSDARLKDVDPDTYRGLGARISEGELGRMLEVFLLQAEAAQKKGITKKLANAAIQSFEAKKAQRRAAKAVRDL